MLSTHPTSQGWVRYRRCVCGSISIELVTPGGPAETTVRSALTPE
ncbi:MAG TPA: hypothetical protein VD903_17350 [Pseudonocardia sp.]|nr:hypothetical protein [Pseudonocardia sp.]